MNKFPLEVMESLFNHARTNPESTFDQCMAQVVPEDNEANSDQIQYYYSQADMYVAFEMSRKKNTARNWKYKTFASFFSSFKPVIESEGFN